MASLTRHAIPLHTIPRTPTVPCPGSSNNKPQSISHTTTIRAPITQTETPQEHSKRCSHRCHETNRRANFSSGSLVLTSPITHLSSCDLGVSGCGGGVVCVWVGGGGGCGGCKPQPGPAQKWAKGGNFPKMLAQTLVRRGSLPKRENFRSNSASRPVANGSRTA